MSLYILYVWSFLFNHEITNSLKYTSVLSYFLLLLNVFFTLIQLFSIFKFSKSIKPGVDLASLLNLSQKIIYFGFCTIFLINVGYLLSEYIKCKLKKISFHCKFLEINSIKSNKEKVSLVLNAFLYSCFFFSILFSFTIGIPFEF